MYRSALRNLLHSLIAASLPLAAVGCDHDTGLPDNGDLAVVQHADLSQPPVDAAVTPDLTVAGDMTVPDPRPDLSMRSGDLGPCPPLPPPTPCEFDTFAPGPVPANPTAQQCQQLCNDPAAFFCAAVGGPPCNQVHCTTCAIGRRPATLVDPPLPCAEDEVGVFFAAVAHLEAASVEAFEELERDLRRLGAPPALVAQAARAADDERRHARDTTAQARRFGGEPARPEVRPRPPRDLEALAIENAVEGCVRETYGALVACWQERAASDLAVRQLMAGIAEDETRHAELSWAIARWAEPRLDEAALARVAQARRAAALTLLRDTQVNQSPRLMSVAGLPGAAQAHFLATRLLVALEILDEVNGSDEGDAEGALAG